MTDFHAKPGREAYTLLDKGFFYGLGAVSRVFDEAGVSYALYGGTGMQTHFSRELAGDRSIDTIPELPKYLRPTSDFDIAVSRELENRRTEEFVSRLNTEEEFDDEAYQSEVIRNGAKRPIFKVTRITDKDEYDTIIFLNIHNDDDRHIEMVSDRERAHLLYTPIAVDVSVAPVEYTVAGKLARASLIRDVPDIVKALELFPDTDLNKVASILKRLEGKEPYVRRMIGRVREGRGALVDYLRRIDRMSE